MTSHIILSGSDIGGAIVEVEDAKEGTEFSRNGFGFRVVSISTFTIEGVEYTSGQAVFTGLAN